ncbi:MAG: hypothetical protein EPO08_10880 [Rhodospirillaceae bacterium]|nr:MAG: hypothetical protein EPO08_10880 [Rhodospirillaceae bacterium]
MRARSTRHHAPKNRTTAKTEFPRAGYKIEQIIPPSPMHGIHGLAFGPDGALYAASLMGHTIYKVDITTGAATPYVGAPRGSAGDIAFGPNGTLAWTAAGEAAVLTRAPDGGLKTVAHDVTGVKAVNFTKDGRLFFSRIAEGDGLFEASLGGASPPRTIAEKIGGLGAFQFDGAERLYGPLIFRGKLVRMNITTGEVTEIAKGFTTPSAVRIGGDGKLVALDCATGEVIRVDPKTGDKAVLATLDPPVDDLAIAKDGTIYVSSSAFNGITAIDPLSLKTRRVTWGGLSAPGAVVPVADDKAETLLVADAWGARLVDPASGSSTLINRGPGVVGATSIAATEDTYILGNIWPAGTIQIVARDSGKVLANLTNFGAPYDIKPLSDGFVVADYAVGRLTKVANDAAHTRTTLAWGFDGPVGLADAGKGVFYVSEYDSGKITRVDTATNERTTVIAGLEAPEGLALAPDGRLIVAEVGARRVIAVTPASGAAEILADSLAIGLDGGHAGPFLSTGVAVTRDGAIYVTGDVENVLYRLTAPHAPSSPASRQAP